MEESGLGCTHPVGAKGAEIEFSHELHLHLACVPVNEALHPCARSLSTPAAHAHDSARRPFV